MQLIANIFLSILLVIIILQDFKYRKVHILVLLGVYGVCTGILFLKTKTLFNLQSLFYVAVIFSLLWLYISIRKKAFINPLKEHIGLGDVLFLAVISPLFTLHNYMLFFISGMIFSLLITIILRKFINKQLVPLAGILAGYLVLVNLSLLYIGTDLLHSNIFNQL